MIFKPKSCKDCEVAIRQKDKIICGVDKSNFALVDKEKEIVRMYNKCVLDWDKK